MDKEIRPSDLPLLSDIPWGSHCCLFYQKKGDLLDILVPYFKAGLGNNEFCMWVCSEPLRAEEARRALAKVIPEFNSYREKGQIEILPHTDWFLLGGRFNPEHVLRGWKDKLNQALARNFEGLRLSGNTFWLGKRDWKRFAGYEEDVNRMITEHKMIALCTYSLDRCGVGEIIDVISNHQSTVIRRGRTWTKAENSSFLKIAERKRYSRPKEPERKPVEIAQLVQEALKFLRSSIPSGIQIREVMDAGAAMCLADPTQIHQVVMNLCQNAACAMQDREGILEVDLAVIGVSEDLPASGHDLKPGSYIKLSVSDTGEGTRPEVLERAFDPFFTAKKPGKSAGVGLSVAMGIVKSHGGTITVSSQLGKGSVFHVYLPRIEGAQAPPVAPPFPVPRGHGRILFVDDEDIQVRTMTAMLERLGYQVIGKTDPRDALQEFRLRPEAFDLIITDQNMPLLAGEKLAGEILRLRPEMPIILCTGYSAQVDEETAKAIGIREFVMKPFSIQEIAGTIRRVLES